MLAHFHTYGMKDLEFIIVNSKLQHAQATLQELQSRVSFNVYQETEEEEVWSVMEGGKDDMYVYDRCGRLTYYIPFPLSIMHEQQNIVSTAVLATYFRSPCGVTCDKNSSSAVQDFIEEIERSEEMANSTANSIDVLNITEVISPETELLNITDNFNATELNDTAEISQNVNEYDFPLNNTDFDNFNDTDYAFENDTVEHHEAKNSSFTKAHGFFNNIVSLFFSEEEFKAASGHTYNKTYKNNSETMVSSESNLHNESNHQDMVHNSGQHSTGNDNTARPNKRKSDRCAEADFDVCKDWSKKRLLHAQKCCSASSRAILQIEDQRACRNFGKRRCKKIQSLLKCCINTVIANAPTTTEQPTTTESIATTEAIVVCCKLVENGKLCRVAEGSSCEEGEYVAESTNMTM